MIRLEGITKVYRGVDGPVHALDGLSMSVDRGEFVAVRGPSGSGKSTLLTLIGGLGTPTQGRIFVADRDLLSMTVGERNRFRAKTIGFVFQMFHLIPYLNVIENVRVPVLADRADAGTRRAGELLQRFGLSHRLRHRPEELSTGERQRVAIARALINDPELILADEPTGNLDPDSAATVVSLLTEFHRGGGTILLVTHEEFAASHAGRTVMLHGGRVEAGLAAPVSSTPT
jgi:ABC-type lipoprotein export system ATPase subunit